MSHLSFRAAALGALRSADLELEPGRYLVLANEPEPLKTLVALAAGAEPPRRGQVLLDGDEPSDEPLARRKIAALLAEEALPPDVTVEGSVARVLDARRAPAADAARLLKDAGLVQLAPLAPSALTERDTRSVALALALAHEAAALLVLHEPLSTSVDQQYVLSALDRHNARGAVVLATTTSSADAMLLGGSWLCVELGRLQAGSGALTAPRLGVGPWQRVLVETPDPKALALALSDSPLGLWTELGVGESRLAVTGPALDVTVREVIALARQRSIEISSIAPALPAVDVLMAARAGYARGAYEASRAAAQAPPSVLAGGLR